MTGKDEMPQDFEQRLRRTLEQSVTGVDARVRSRLNQARQAAVAQAAQPYRPWRLAWMPALGAVTAAVLVALLLRQSPQPALPAHPLAAHATLQAAPAMDDLDLLADGDGLDLIQNDDGAFYEWALLQSDDPGPGGGNGV